MRRPTLSKILTEPCIIWQQVSVLGWDGMGERRIEIATATAVWHHFGLSAVPIRWVLIRNPENPFEPQGLLCTDPMRDPTQIVTWFVQRWQVEVTLKEARAHLGVETHRQWYEGYRSYDPLSARPVLHRYPARHPADST